VDEANATVGEKIELRRFATFDGNVAVYLHRKAPDLPPQVGVLVQLDKRRRDETARGVAQHIAALRPTYLSRDDVPAEVVEKERRLAEETSREEGKPEAALPKIIEGRVNGFFKDFVLLEQAVARHPKKTVKPRSSKRPARHSQALRPLRGRGLSKPRGAVPVRSGHSAHAEPPFRAQKRCEENQPG
jgi:elongation factor Ts